MSHHALAANAALATLSLCVAEVAAQAAWTADPRPAPPPRFIHALSPDGTGGVLLFGGFQRPSPGVMGDFWRHDQNGWQPLAANPMPAARSGHGMVYDLWRNRVVLFGGAIGTGATAELWEWDGSTWRTPTAVGSWPAARTQFGICFDWWRGRTVVFGGTSFDSITWEWDGTAWSSRAGVAPSSRQACAMTFDSDRGLTVLFGGYDTQLLQDTWEYDGTAWVARQPALRPPARCCNTIAYDPARQRTVLFGGALDVPNTDHADTWEWDGVSWTQRQSPQSPPARRGTSMVYEPVRARMILFGGGSGQVGLPPFNDTWEFFTPNPARWSIGVPGCAGSAGIPALAPASASPPWGGAPWPVAVTSVPTAAFALLAIGLSDTLFGTTPLPVALDPQGLTGCLLGVSADAVAAMPVQGGVPTLPLPLPATAAFFGMRLYLQALVLDPPANLAGLTLSNSLGITIGGR